MEIVADVVDVGAEIRVREHDTLGRAGGGNESFVTETFAGNVGASVGDDDLFQIGKAGADGEKLLQLWRANNEDDFGAAMFQDVGGAVGRFVEVNRHGDGAEAVDCEVGGVPLGAVGGKKADAVAGLHAEFDESSGKAGDAAEKFL